MHRALYFFWVSTHADLVLRLANILERDAASRDAVILRAADQHHDSSATTDPLSRTGTASTTSEHRGSLRIPTFPAASSAAVSPMLLTRDDASDPNLPVPQGGASVITVSPPVPIEPTSVVLAREASETSVVSDASGPSDPTSATSSRMPSLDRTPSTTDLFIPSQSSSAGAAPAAPGIGMASPRGVDRLHMLTGRRGSLHRDSAMSDAQSGNVVGSAAPATAPSPLQAWSSAPLDTASASGVAGSRLSASIFTDIEFDRLVYDAVLTFLAEVMNGYRKFLFFIHDVPFFNSAGFVQYKTARDQEASKCIAAGPGGPAGVALAAEAAAFFYQRFVESRAFDVYLEEEYHPDAYHDFLATGLPLASLQLLLDEEFKEVDLLQLPALGEHELKDAPVLTMAHPRLHQHQQPHAIHVIKAQRRGPSDCYAPFVPLETAAVSLPSSLATLHRSGSQFAAQTDNAAAVTTSPFTSPFSCPLRIADDTAAPPTRLSVEHAVAAVQHRGSHSLDSNSGHGSWGSDAAGSTVVIGGGNLRGLTGSMLTAASRQSSTQSGASPSGPPPLSSTNSAASSASGSRHTKGKRGRAVTSRPHTSVGSAGLMDERELRALDQFKHAVSRIFTGDRPSAKELDHIRSALKGT